jgi:hypothetical protein
VRVKGLDGRTYNLALAGRVARPGDAGRRSNNHLVARGLLLAVFPFDPPYEEVLVPGCGPPLYLDFLLPQRRLAVEVQGRQHREYVAYFHGTPARFAAQRGRDRLKAEWCALNGLTLVHLHDDSLDEWEHRLRNAFAPGPGLAGPPAGEDG